MMHVLVTRPADEAAATKSRIEALGHRVSVAPLLAIEATGAAIDLSGVQAVIVTSGNALKVLKDHPAIEGVRALPVFAVGRGTAELAEALGFQRVMAGPGSARALADVIAATAEPGAGTLLHISGETIAFDMSGPLARAGFLLRRAEVYRAVAARSFPSGIEAQLRAGAIDAVLLMSPRTAAVYSDLINLRGLGAEARAIAYICLSQAVANNLVTLAPNTVKIAAQPSLEEVLALVEAMAAHSLNQL